MIAEAVKDAKRALAAALLARPSCTRLHRQRGVGSNFPLQFPFNLGHN